MCAFGPSGNAIEMPLVVLLLCVCVRALEMVALGERENNTKRSVQIDQFSMQTGHVKMLNRFYISLVSNAVLLVIIYEENCVNWV